jgi:beta-lactamase superfamily II metal-dependent hydrolase
MNNRRHKEKTMRAIKALLTITLVVCSVSGQSRNDRPLDIYVVDVEGGNAVLFVTPAGESVLIDSGNGGAAAARDADRIMAAVREAGIKQIDHLITTHYHGDHVGGLPELAKRIPVLGFIDHGPNVQPSSNIDPVLQQYAEIHSKVKHTIAKPGDRIQLTGMDWRIVTAGGAGIKTAIPGAGTPNTACAEFKPQDPDMTENAQSVGSVITFGSFRVVHLGDLTWNKEFDLMCPNNRIGVADLFIVSHHGQATSNSPVLVHGVRPRVAIMNNGTRKGGQPDAMKVLFSSPGLEDLWQMHFSLLSGQEYTVPGAFIANMYDEQPGAMPVTPFLAPPQGQQPPPPPQHNGTAYYFKISARSDGTFTVTNTRNGFSKTYNKERS